jgi:NDP-sugar pyrophosphorylase family protein
MGKLTVLVLMAGSGSRVKQLEPNLPKPFAKINDTPMLDYVLHNLEPLHPSKYIFVCRQEHLEIPEVKNYFLNLNVPHEIVTTSVITQGAACSALLASHLFCEDELLIANSDQFVEKNLNHFIEEARLKKLDGSILTMLASGNKWSYAALDHLNYVSQVAEKQPISEHATVGLYWFKSGLSFEKAARSMIEKNIRTNNEFYLAPVYNELINAGKKIGIYHIGEHGKEVHGLGTTEDIMAYEALRKNANFSVRKKNA